MSHEPACATCYLAEIFLPRGTPERLLAEAERVRAAAEALDSSGARVRYLHSLFVPHEETAFHLFEATRPDVIEQVLRDAGLEPERISSAIAAAGPSRALKTTSRVLQSEKSSRSGQ